METLTGQLGDMYTLKKIDGNTLLKAISIAKTIGSIDAPQDSIRSALNTYLKIKDDDSSPVVYTISEAI
jgi:hypothetical protein